MLKSRNPEFREYVEYKIERNRFMHYIGFQLEKVEPGRVEGFLDFEEFHEQQNGYLHGGVTGTVADIVMGFAAYTLVAHDEQVFTVESKVNYFRPGVGNRVRAIGWVEKAGSRFHFCESEIWMESEIGKNTLVAKSNATMAVREKLNGET